MLEAMSTGMSYDSNKVKDLLAQLDKTSAAHDSFLEHAVKFGFAPKLKKGKKSM